MKTHRRLLWKCPRCGAKLISRGLSHSCGPYTVEKFLQGKSSKSRVLFERFVRLIGACGPYEVAPARTRVAFMASVRFASVNRLGAASLDAHFVLPETVASPRFRRVERLGKLTVHHLRFTEPQQMDEEVQAWLRRSYAEYGERRWLKRPSTATGRVRRASSVPRQRRKATRPRSRARTA